MNKRPTLWGRLGFRARLLVLLTPALLLAGVAQHVFQLQYKVAESQADMAREAASLMDLMTMRLTGPAGTEIIEEYSRNPLVARIEWHKRSGERMEIRGFAPEKLAPAWFQRYFGIPPLLQARMLEAYGMFYGDIRVTFSGAQMENRLWREASDQLWQFGLFLVLLLLILSAFLSRWLRPLETINAAGRRFMEGDYAVRVADSRRFVPEIRAMADMLNKSVAQVGGMLISLSEQRRAIDNAVIVTETDIRGVITYVNDKFYQVSGYSRDEVIGHDHRFLKSGAHSRTFFEDLWSTLRRGNTWQGEICNRNKSGNLFWLLTTITPVVGTDGAISRYISVRVDITQRKLAEDALKQQAQIIDQIHDALFVADLRGTLVSWNRGASELFGYSSHDALGQLMQIIVATDDSELFSIENCRKKLQHGGCNQDIRLRRQSGEIFDAHISMNLLRDGEGNELGMVGYVLDITARKVIENALRASEKKYRNLVESMHDWVWEVNEHGAYTYSSPRVRQMLGYEPEEVLGKTPFDLMSPEEAERVSESFSACVAARKPINMLENINLHRDGTPVVLETSGVPIIDEQGEFRGYQGVDRDITERKRFELAIQDSQNRLAKAQHMARLGNWDWDVVNDIVLCSDELYRIFGASPDFVFNRKSFLNYVHPDDLELVEKSIVAALAGEVSYSVDFRILAGYGAELVVHSEGEVEFDAAGKGVRMFGLVQDITERKQIEQEIRASREQLRELSNHLQTIREEEKSCIAREIHDELGGNLTALKMDIFWLGRKLPPEMEAAHEKVASMSDMVDASVHALRRIVTELRPTVLDDLGLVAAMQWQAAEFAKRYGIQCKVSMHGEEVELTEEMRITLFRIFQEALTNVARYSKASQVLVDMWREHDKIALEVFDNGIGIPEGAIMQPTAHGLRGMMERARSLGGSVEIGSAPGEGVAISVRIPVAGAAEIQA